MMFKIYCVSRESSKDLKMRGCSLEENTKLILRKEHARAQEPS